MSNYREEQEGEIEALLSIYSNEIEVVTTVPYHVFKIHVQPQSPDNDSKPAFCTIQFTYVEHYPDDKPLIEITSYENLDEKQVSTLLGFMSEQAEENLGMVMIFTIVSAVQEKISDIIDEVKIGKEKEKLRKQQEAEEAERKRLEGTKVTIESFLAWRTKFDAEIMELKRLRETEPQSRKTGRTGKELFMEDSSMNDSDVKFLQNEGDSVEVDESLFQDLDDLDLNDETVD